MKVLHLSSESSWRGGEQQIAYLIDESQRKGVQCYVMARKNSAFEAWCLENKIPFTTSAFKNDFDLGTAFAIKKYCRKENFDLVHLHSSRSHGTAFLASLAANKTPLVLSRRVDFKLKQNFFSRWKYNHPSIKKIICVSEKIKSIVAKAVHDTARLVTVYDGVDLNRFSAKGRRGLIRKEFGIPENAKLIGNVAAIAPHKDYFTFLDTAKILLEKHDWWFMITGDGPLKDEIKQRIVTLGLQSRVILTGFRNDLENVFADLDLLLYTSKEEGLGSTLLDAMAFGLPVVSTDAGGIPEIVRHEFNGLTAPVRNPEKLAELAERLIVEPALAQKLISNAKEFVKDFSKEKMAERTIAIYREILR